MTSNSTSNYTWNTRNQLTGITGGATASFLYDALGRRESKTISSTSTNFLYDGLNLEQELNGTTPTVNYLTGAGIDETLSRTGSSGTQSYLTDNLGSTLALTNSSGAISTSYSYEPYGNTTASGTSSTNALQYTGRENDGDGLYYYRARYYSPVYSRFISEDPVGYLGGINKYAYTLGNPVNFGDATGLLTGCEINWLNSNYFGTVGGFIADTFNLQQFDPFIDGNSVCSSAKSADVALGKKLLLKLPQLSRSDLVNFIGDYGNKVIDVIAVPLAAFATVAVWQAEMNCVDPITGRPQL